MVGEFPIASRLNSDLSAFTTVDTAQMSWSPSPSGTVWRKRFHQVGPAESGQVSSVVRYQPHSSFPSHDHPDGEEILVLDGVFSDEHGDWPAGSYLLNPEGFRHAPFSRGGCLLFVKLRQYPGIERLHVALNTRALVWQPGSIDGVAVKRLYEQPAFTDSVRLERWRPALPLGVRSYARGSEVFVIEGQFEDASGSYAAGCWLRFPVGSQHRPETRDGCTLYVKEGGFAYLDSDAS